MLSFYPTQETCFGEIVVNKAPWGCRQGLPPVLSMWVNTLQKNCVSRYEGEAHSILCFYMSRRDTSTVSSLFVIYFELTSSKRERCIIFFLDTCCFLFVLLYWMLSSVLPCTLERTMLCRRLEPRQCYFHDYFLWQPRPLALRKRTCASRITGWVVKEYMLRLRLICNSCALDWKQKATEHVRKKQTRVSTVTWTSPCGKISCTLVLKIYIKNFIKILIKNMSW
jgi:hypothetical protein